MGEYPTRLRFQRTMSFHDPLGHFLALKRGLSLSAPDALWSLEGGDTVRGAGDGEETEMESPNVSAYYLYVVAQLRVHRERNQDGWTSNCGGRSQS